MLRTFKYLSPQECLAFNVPLGSRIPIDKIASNEALVCEVPKVALGEADGNLAKQNSTPAPQEAVKCDSTPDNARTNLFVETTVVTRSELDRSQARMKEDHPDNHYLRHADKTLQTVKTELQLRTQELQVAISKIASMQSTIDNMVAKDLINQGDLTRTKMEVQQLKARIDSMVPKAIHDECREQLVIAKNDIVRLEKSIADISARNARSPTPVLSPDNENTLRFQLQQTSEELDKLRLESEAAAAVQNAAVAAAREEISRCKVEAAGLSDQLEAARASYVICQGELAAAIEQIDHLTAAIADMVPRADVAGLEQQLRALQSAAQPAAFVAEEPTATAEATDQAASAEQAVASLLNTAAGGSLAPAPAEVEPTTTASVTSPEAGKGGKGSGRGGGGGGNGVKGKRGKAKK